MSTASHLAKLNAAQRRAVTHGEALPEKGLKSGPLLIVAGAGTGKTDTLAHRVAHLGVNGVDPARILLLTFTRRAALEMRRRARDIVKKIKDSKLKLQASINGDLVRISGKDRDTLQQAIALLKGADFGIELQFINFRTN